MEDYGGIVRLWDCEIVGLCFIDLVAGSCGVVAQWLCGVAAPVASWLCSPVALWRCGPVALGGCRIGRGVWVGRSTYCYVFYGPDEYSKVRGQDVLTPRPKLSKA